MVFVERVRQIGSLEVRKFGSLEEMEQLRSSGPVKPGATRFLSTTTRSVTSTSNRRVNGHRI
jgi:hypothetical protein